MNKFTRLSALVAAGAFALSMAACSSSGSDQSASSGSAESGGSSSGDSLTIYTGRDKDEVAEVVEEFEAAYPQYAGKVQTVIASSQDNLDRLRAEKDNPQAGFLWGGTQQQFTQAASEGLLAQVTPEYVDAIDPEYRSDDGTWYAEQLLPEVIIYNSNLLTEDQAPTDWDDLASDQFSGQVIVRDVMPSGTMQTIYAAMVYRAFEETGSPDEGYDFLKKLDANTVSYAATPDDMYVQLDQGVGTVTMWNLQDALIQTLKNGHPWKYVMPSSGAPVLKDGVGVVQNSDQLQAATDFLNFLMEPGEQAKLAADYYQLPAMTIDDSQKPDWMKDLDLKNMDIDWTVFDAHQDEWMTYWSENIKQK